MTIDDMAIRVADNLNILSRNGTQIIESQVTLTGIVRKLIDIYCEELFPMMSEAFPADFVEHLYAQPTYTASGVVSASSTGTTLISTLSMFSNDMQGFEVENVTDGALAKIVTYVSPTQVTLDTSIGDTWDGDTIAVLGNEFQITGNLSNLKTIVQARIKYKAGDTVFIPCELSRKQELLKTGYEVYSTIWPQVYLSSILVNGRNVRTFGFLPFPTSWQGEFELDYLAKPTIISSDEPALTIPGISEVMINGCTAWGLRKLEKYDESDRYMVLYEGRTNDPKCRYGKIGLLRNYKPFAKSNTFRLKQSAYSEAIRRRRI